jgi:arginine utilization protein RocB
VSDGATSEGGRVSALPWAGENEAELRQTLERWIREPSVTQTPGETLFGLGLAGTVAAVPYFRRFPEQLSIECTTSGAPVVVARVAGQVATDGPRPIVLLCGHYDTVGDDEFAGFPASAFDAEAVRRAALDAADASDEVRRDAASGEYLFGRGSLDMKAGIVAALSAIEVVSRSTSELAGDLVFVATPDEENLSEGARLAAEMLRAWQAREPLEFRALLNLDYVTGDPLEPPVHFGALGKVLPCFVAIGVPTHVGDPFGGVDSITLAAAIVDRLSLLPALQEHWLERSTPPVLPLTLTELRDRYSVQTAAVSAASLNLFVKRRSLADSLGILENLTRDAWASVSSRYERSGAPPPRLLVTRPRGVSVDVKKGSSDVRERVRDAVVAALEATPDGRPIVGWYLGPGAWAPVPDPDDIDGGRLRRAVNRAAAAVGARVKDGGPYPYISDMSLLAGSFSDDDSKTLEVEGIGVRPVAKLLDEAGNSFPCANVGPIGSNAHGRSERSHVPWSLGVLPNLLVSTVLDLLRGREGVSPG